MSKPIFEHHLQKISKEELQEAVASYREGLDKNETTSCLVGLDDIQKMIAHYSNLLAYPEEYPKIIGFRIYFFRGGNQKFIRKNEKEFLNDEYAKVQDGKLQLNIIMVPVCDNKKHPNEQISKGFAKDMLVDEKCWVLIPGGENTGLCPTNCPKG